MEKKSPLHSQLKEKIIAMISEGTLRPGDQLPTQNELGAQYEMSHMTVRRALDELIKEGVIRSVRGKGLYVTSQTLATDIGSLFGFDEQILRLGMTPSKRILCAEIIPASTVLAQMLKVEVGIPLVSLERLLLANNTPVALIVAYLPHHLCPGMISHDLEKGSMFATLRQVYGLQLSGAVSIVQTVLASKEQANLLQIQRPAALLSREQLTYLSDGTIIEFSRSFLRGDNYHIRVQEGVIPPS
jgi:GntR family transcriptional regulator